MLTAELVEHEEARRRRAGTRFEAMRGSPDLLRGVEGEPEALRMPLGPYRCISWCVRRKRVPQALQRMGLLVGPRRH